MPSRAMVVVGGGSSTRFGSDKLMTEVAGRPLIAHTIDAVIGHVDICVVVCHPGIVATVAELEPEVVVAAGGATRTESEISGLAALTSDFDLIGVHDAARPLVSSSVIERLFAAAAQSGGAVPLLTVEGLILDRATSEPVAGLWRAQTPQVFRGPELVAAYHEAAKAGMVAHDTAEVVERFGDLTVVGVEGDPDNIKVTYPADLERLSSRLAGPFRT
jgi:2-C-methyl-D-erythritol 4-phosphate cytidylyltransferase